MEPTFYWHDYETWGTRPSIDRPSQFAGVRTNENLEIIGEPLVIYSKPPVDILPQPMACLVTGITPQHAEQHGVCEAEFIAQIHKEMAQPVTCTVGYNSIRFDDEVTRYTLFRNLYDPYEREWKNGNSRWDIIDMVRCTYALKPEGIEWPVIDGKPRFKLELLTQSNNIDHGAAHDAYCDVAATIALAKLIKEKQPALYQHIYALRDKKSVGKLIDIKNNKPLLHISSKFSAENGCAGFVAPVAMHPTNKNAVICVVLDRDPALLQSLSVEDITKQLYTPTSELAEGQVRLPIKCIHLNKCPILLTTKMVTPGVEARLGLSKHESEQHWYTLKSLNIASKLQDVFRQNAFDKSTDPEQQLYDGFISNADKQTMSALRDAGASANHKAFYFNDERLNKILPRYLARNFFDRLSKEKQDAWHSLAHERVMQGGEGAQSLSQFHQEIAQLTTQMHDQPAKLEILNALKEYGQRWQQ